MVALCNQSSIVPGDVKEVVANRGLVRVRLPRTCRGGGGAGGTLVLVVAVVPLLPTGVWALERVGSRERTWADRGREWPLGRVGVLWLVPPAFAFASIALQRRMLRPGSGQALQATLPGWVARLMALSGIAVVLLPLVLVPISGVWASGRPARRGRIGAYAAVLLVLVVWLGAALDLWQHL
jgi:hypothetical protein